MRFHQLAKSLGVEPEVLMEFAKEKTGQEYVAVSGVSSEMEEYLRGRLSSASPEFEEVELEEPETADLVAKHGLGLEEVNAVEAGLEVTPPEDRFAVVDEYGNYRDTLKLEPLMARRLEETLDGRKVGGYCFYPEANQLKVVTFPDGQLLTVSGDE